MRSGPDGIVTAMSVWLVSRDERAHHLYVEFRVLGNDGSELLGKCLTVTVKSLGKQAQSLCKTQLLKWVFGTGTGASVPAQRQARPAPS